MPKPGKEDHFDIYKDRYELHQDGKTEVYQVGAQSEKTQKRYADIKEALAEGYLEKKIARLQEVDLSQLAEGNQALLRRIVDGITSEAGRALVGLTFLQLTIKSIAPEQCIRLHKGTTRKGSFSWVDGISMRTLDASYSAPFLREHELLNINKFGIMMTRSPAENYPYSKFYKADMKGPFGDWIAIVDALENETMPPELGLCYLLTLLKNRSDKFKKTANQACELAEQYGKTELEQVQTLLTRFFSETNYSARAFEVVMHGLLQAMGECKLLGDATLVPMSQMRSANKKHGNVGDVELMEGSVIIEAWDAKYGKSYLRDELEELRDKLLAHPEVKAAGFVVDSSVDWREDIKARVKELCAETGAEIFLCSFTEWVERKTGSLSPAQKSEIGPRWLKAVVGSFARRRTEAAPIDEPCEAWLEDMIKLLQDKSE